VNENSPGARAVKAYEVEDVFLLDLECSVFHEFNPLEQLPPITYKHSIALDEKVLIQTRADPDGSNKVAMVRYFINSEVIVLKPGSESEEHSDQPVPKDARMASMKFTLATDYTCPTNMAADQDAILAFGKNAMFHAWPYVRETVHLSCEKLRIPRITIGMFKPDPKPVEPSEAVAVAVEKT
jgi:hypothetical protein